MEYLNGHDFQFRALYISQIKFDSSYQREVDMKRIRRIAKNFNGDLVNEPKVSERDGSYWCFNGQHTIKAWEYVCKEKGITAPTILCKVYTGMTQSDESRAFVDQNGFSKDPTKNDKLRAQYNDGLAPIVDMVNRAREAGYIVDFAKGSAANRIVATGELFDTYCSLGAEKFSDMLFVLRRTWGNDKDSTTGDFIKGMRYLWKTFEDDIDPTIFVAKLGKVSASGVVQESTKYSASLKKYERYALALAHFYNERLKKGGRRLDDTLL